jgi:hypothetical protein
MPDNSTYLECDTLADAQVSILAFSVRPPSSASRPLRGENRVQNRVKIFSNFFSSPVFAPLRGGSRGFELSVAFPQPSPSSRKMIRIMAVREEMLRDESRTYRAKKTANEKNKFMETTKIQKSEIEFGLETSNSNPKP